MFGIAVVSLSKAGHLVSQHTGAVIIIDWEYIRMRRMLVDMKEKHLCLVTHAHANYPYYLLG